MRFFIAILIACVGVFAAGCTFDHNVGDIDDASNAPNAYQAPSYGDTIASSPLFRPGGWSDRHEWSYDGDVPYDADDFFDFDGFTAYAVNMVDSSALSLDITGIMPGDVLSISGYGIPYAEHYEPGVTCILQTHVADDVRGGGDEAPIASGGGLSFDLGITEQPSAAWFYGRHVASSAGVTRVRVLGKVSRPDRFCGIGGSAALRVTRTRL